MLIQIPKHQYSFLTAITKNWCSLLLMNGCNIEFTTILITQLLRIKRWSYFAKMFLLVTSFTSASSAILYLMMYFRTFPGAGSQRIFMVLWVTSLIVTPLGPGKGTVKIMTVVSENAIQSRSIGLPEGIKLFSYAALKLRHLLSYKLIALTIK